MSRTLTSRLAVLAFGLFLGGWAKTARAQDPGAPGPLAVTREEYNFGDTAFAPSDLPGPGVELRASVHHPTDLATGPFPFLLFLHGRHATCFSGANATLEWPCPAGSQPIPSFRGYDYAAEVLASHGFFVVSVSANGVNAQDQGAPDLGALARAELLQRHLEIWRTFNATGAPPFGARFVGKVDLARVGTMGHSRGGEGVVRHFLLNASQGSPFGIKAVFPLAPVDFSRPVINDVSLLVLLPYCDGDVLDLQGAHFYEDARYNVPGDPSPKHTLLVMGANHNFYNTVWTPGLFPAGAFDDWTAIIPGGAADPHCGTGPGNRRLTPTQQQGTGKAFLAAFFRAYVADQSQFLPILTAAAPAPPSATTDDLHVSYHAPDLPSRRRDVNRLLDAANLTTNTPGGAVTQSGLSPYDLCGGEAPQPRFCLQISEVFFATLGITPHEPHVAPSFLAPTKRGLSQLRFGWVNATSTAEYRNDLPAGARNVSGFEALQFRASVNFEGRNLPGQPQDFSVIMTDGAGRSASVRVGARSSALFFPPGRVVAVPKAVQNTVRLPLLAFSGVNLGDVRSIRFRFNQRVSGDLLVSDLAFASRPE